MFQNETTALHVACMDNHQAEDSVLLCDLLIKAGAKVDAIDVDGHTPLHFCCLYGLSDSAKILVRIYQGYLLHTTYKHKMLLPITLRNLMQFMSFIYTTSFLTNCNNFLWIYRWIMVLILN